MLTIDKQWEAFRKDIAAVDAPLAQRLETKMSFYAGAAAMLSLQVELAGLDEQAALSVITGLHEEVAMFSRHLQGL